MCWNDSYLMLITGFPGGSAEKNLTDNVGAAGNLGWIPGSGRSPGGRSPGGRHGTPLQESCLENPMDRGAWWTTVHGVEKESDTTEVT